MQAMGEAYRIDPIVTTRGVGRVQSLACWCARFDVMIIIIIIIIIIFVVIVS
jgi:hypothetical protein